MAKVKTSFLFKAFFGTLPKTDTLEANEKALIQEYNEIIAFSESEELKNILEMEKEINSETFKNNLQAIKDDTFDKTEEYNKLQQYNQLKKSKTIRAYFKYQQSGKLEQLDEIEKSGKLEKLEELEKEVTSTKFNSKKEDLKGEDAYDGSPESQLEEEYNRLLKDADLKRYDKIKNTTKYKRYIETHESKKLETYFKLEELVNSKEFQDFKAEKEDTERYKQSDEYKLQQRYEAAMAQDMAKKYFGLKDSSKFDDLKNFELTFYDDFDNKTLDPDKWINNYFWGKALMNESYSLASDKHFITNGNNIEIKDSICRIVTKKEKATGKSWDPRIGFYPREFDYTSGLISTGESFRQKTGRFQAKVRLNNLTPVTNAFWMVSEKMLPQIDVFKTGNKNKISIASHWGKDNKSNLAKFGGSKFANDFFIFTLEWTPEKLIWKINDIVVKEQTSDIPTDPMYLIFSSGLQVDPQDNALPSTMEIDWVKCYHKVDKK